jgi:hypothetical protein
VSEDYSEPCNPLRRLLDVQRRRVEVDVGPAEPTARVLLGLA